MLILSPGLNKIDGGKYELSCCKCVNILKFAVLGRIP